MTLSCITSFKKRARHDYTTSDIKKLNLTKYNSTKSLVLNSIGKRVTLDRNTKITLREFPFYVSRCDQIVTFKAQYIPDMGEYRHREDGWFTLTAHFTNLFNDNSAEKLIRSIMMTATKVMPSHLRGTGNCILIRGGIGDKDLTICLPDKYREDNILEVLEEFAKCRGGLYDSHLDKLRITQDILECSKEGIYEDPRILLAKLKAKQKKKVNFYDNYNTRKDWGYFHPGSDDVPGLPSIEDYDERHREKPIVVKLKGR